MTDGICFAGLDVHARKTAAAAVQLGSGEVWKAQLAGTPQAAIEWLQTLPGEVRAVYEAGPTGFGLARAARAAGIEVMVCSPGAIPRQPGDRVKTDTRDALKLARLHAAGQLRPVVVPAIECEALRDLVRAREDLRGDLMAARHRISKLLLRHGHVFDEPGETWSRRGTWRGWARCASRQPLTETVFGEYLGHHEVLLARRDRLDAADRRAGRPGPWAPAVARLALPARDRHADRGRAGRRDRRHPRLRASQAARELPRPGPVRALLRRAPPPGLDHQGRLTPRAPAADRGRLALPPTAPRLADAQAPPGRPVTGRDRRRLARAAAAVPPLGAPRRRRGKKRTTVAVAVARELACFVWEIARLPD